MDEVLVERTVVLARHAAPLIEPEVPRPEWALSPAGLDSCITLAEDLAGLLPSTLVSSTEPKAVQTATVISERLGLNLTTSDGLIEHKRSGEYLSESGFNSRIRSFFQRTDEVVYGQESCEELGLRIENEVEAALSSDSARNAILVTHGTAMTSFIMRHWHVDPFELWKSLGLPAYLAFTVPTFDIVGTRGVDATLFKKTHSGA